MAVLLDTSVLGRLANAADPAFSTACTSISKLHLAKETIHITPQNIVEFRNVATRVKHANGLGLSPSEAEALIATFEQSFPLLEETSDIFPRWKQIVGSLGVIGKQVHDARLVAVCHVHSIPKLMTFNIAHFTRFSGFAPGIVVIDPATV